LEISPFWWLLIISLDVCNDATVFFAMICVFKFNKSQMLIHFIIKISNYYLISLWTVTRFKTGLNLISNLSGVFFCSCCYVSWSSCNTWSFVLSTF
jgi:hypothetical protein